MSRCVPCFTRLAPPHAAALAVIVALAVWSSEALAQFNQGGFVSRAVGGVAIDAQGVLTTAQRDDVGRLGEEKAKALAEVSRDLAEPNELRKVSLRRLEAAIAGQVQTGNPLPDEIRYLAGLQRVRYVFVYPDEKDIVLAGFGEGWVVDQRGNVVGATTGRPVLLLDDLLVALRTAEGARQGGITCSIDPTAEGLRRLKQFEKTLAIGGNPQVAAASIEAQLGPQTITVTGVPATSHFARVLVAADYRMKRLAMNFEPSPVAGLPSFLHMMKSGARGIPDLLPRWWLATHYEPLLSDAEGLAWELRGPGVKAMTEDDYIGADGSRQRTGKANPVAQKWAQNMTASYEPLSIKEPIFGELRNCMDLAVVAALIVKEGLATKAGCSLPLLLNPSDLPVDEFFAPKQVDTQASFVEKRKHYVFSASGGVLIHSWSVADNKQQSDSLGPIRAGAEERRSTRWWWN